MILFNIGYRQLQDVFRMDSETLFNVQLLSGSLLMGSSIAYPILSQDRSRWSSVALCTFFLSGMSFNGLQICKILKYGHYTLVVCVVGTILIMAFGHNTLTEHAHFIPVYAMGSSFVTAAWPSLEESWMRVRNDGHPPLPRYIQETTYHPAARSTFLEEYRVESEAQAARRAAMSRWLRDQSQQRSPPPSLSPLPSLAGGGHPPEQQPADAWVRDIQHMGPASNRDQARSNTDTSISLSWRPAVPSEVSNEVYELLVQNSPARIPRDTQRRRDIDSLGRMVPPREEPSSSGGWLTGAT